METAVPKTTTSARHRGERAEDDQQPLPAALRVARATYLAGSVAFLFIGVMHTVVHLTAMSGTALEAQFAALGAIDGVSVWRLWMGLSLLMGLFSAAIGATNLAVLNHVGPRSFPPAAVCLVSALCLAVVTLVGLAWLGPIQAIGGPVGIVMFATPIVLARRACRQA